MPLDQQYYIIEKCGAAKLRLWILQYARNLGVH